MTDRPPDAGARRPAAAPSRPDLAATLVLLRHGQSDWLAEGRFQGRSDTPLSPLGRRQAALAGRAPGRARRARRACPSPPASPSRSSTRRSPGRARRPRRWPRRSRAAGRPAPPLRPEPGLAEIAQGAWEGLLQREVEERYPAEIAGWRRDPVARPRARRRIARARWTPASAPPSAACSTELAGGRRAPGPAGTPSYYDPHAGPWALLVGPRRRVQGGLLALLGLPLDRFWTFTQTTTGIAVLDIRNGRTILRAWNRTEHLAPLELEAAEATRAEEDAAAERARTGAL